MSGIPHWAVSGAAIVCVDASLTYPTLKERAVYIIQRAQQTQFGPMLKLVGVGSGPDCMWLIARFRPTVDDREVEVELYRKKRLSTPLAERLMS